MRAMGDKKTPAEILALLIDPNHTSKAWRASYRELEDRVGQYQAGSMVQDALKKRQQDENDRQRSDVQAEANARAQERVLATIIPQLEPHTEAKGRRRPEETGYAANDGPLVAEMRVLVADHKAKSLAEAARKVIGDGGRRAEGIGTPEDKIKRLVKLANEGSIKKRKSQARKWSE
jgi:hypothetical protein